MLIQETRINGRNGTALKNGIHPSIHHVEQSIHHDAFNTCVRKANQRDNGTAL